MESVEVEQRTLKTRLGVANIAARIFMAAGKFRDLPAAGFCGDSKLLSYREYAAGVMSRALALRYLGKLEPVGVLGENCPEWGQAYLSILAAGGVVVPIDPLLKADELGRVLEQSEVNCLYVSEKCRENTSNAISAINRDIRIMPLEEDPGNDPDEFVNTFTDLTDTPAALLFTSGTTGGPKKVILTHGNILSDIEGAGMRLKFGAGDRFMSVLPMHHTFEATCGFLLPLVSGAAIYYLRELNSREILNGIKTHQVTHFISVPLLFEKIYHRILSGVKKAPAASRAMFEISMAAVKALHAITGINAGKAVFGSFRKRAGLHTLRLLVSGGAPLPAQISRDFNLMGLPFIEGYGLTETSPVLTVNPTHKVKFGSVGPALDNAEVRIKDPDAGGVGEIIARGPMITPGYKDDPEETAKLIRDGWLHTGDYGRLDKDGYLYILGRKKNVIVSAAGKNIYPEEIEAELLRSPFILEALIYGKKAENQREEVAAVICPDLDFLAGHLGKDKSDISDDEIGKTIDIEIKLICDRMASFKRIKHVEYSREELAKTSKRTIKRFLYQDGRNQGN